MSDSSSQPEAKPTPSSSLDLLIDPSTSYPPNPPPKSPTALFLERLHAHIVSILNTRNWSHPDLTTYISPDLTAYLEHTNAPYITSRTAFIERYKTICTQYPGYRFELADSNASVDEAKGAALVWFKVRICGHPEGVEREGVYVSMWKKIKGCWICERQNGLRGMKVGEGMEE